MTNFEDIKLGNEVVFEREGILHTAVVKEVTDRTFTVDAVVHYTTNGRLSFYEKKFSFFKKSGKKSHHKYTYSDAISFNKAFGQS